jgi:hypothetical protein
MPASVYAINKGIDKPITFKGLKAQYIWYLGGGLVILLILFAILYICGVPPLFCTSLVLGSGTGWFLYISRMSHRYGAHGMMKKIAAGKVPNVVKLSNRKVFYLGK